MNSIASFAKKNKFYITIFLLSSLSLVYMICLSGIKSLWYDDIYQIYFTWEKTYAEAMKHVLSVDLNPPFWSTFTYFWQKAVPFGTSWLKLPSMLAVCGGTIFTGLCAKRIFGEKTALLAVILTVLHSGVVITCGYSYRAYGALFLFSSFLIYAYARRYFAPTLFNRVLFCIAVFFIGFTHYFGALLCIFLAACDLVLCIKGKQKKSFIVEYLIVGLCELPWLLAQLSNIQETFSDFWTSKPTFIDLIDVLRKLTLDSYILLAIFVVLAVLTVVETVIAVKNKETIYNDNCLLFRILFLSIPVLFILLIFVYSQLNSSASLWVSRYFFFLIPLIIVFIAASFVRATEAIIERYVKTEKKAIISTVCVFAVIIAIFAPQFFIKVHKDTYIEYEPFEQAAEVVMAQPEINGDGQVLIFNTTKCAGGWDYYLGQKNSREMNNVTLVGLHDYSAELAADYDTVIIYAVHFDGSFDEVEIIDELLNTHHLDFTDFDYNIYKFTKK